MFESDIFTSIKTMTAMINLSTCKKTDTINVDVKPVTNVHIGDSLSSTKSGSEPSKEIYVKYPERNVYEEANNEEIIDTLKRENEVLKLVIHILQNNPLIVNKYIIADDEILVKIIQLLCNADEVQIDADDISQGCFTTNIYRKVHTIYVITNGITKNLKYDYPYVMKMLQDLRISTKFVF